MNQKDAIKDLAKVGMSLKRSYGGEYRVNHHKGKEETAYYTDDLQDAHSTGHHMAGYRNGHDKQVRKPPIHKD